MGETPKEKSVTPDQNKNASEEASWGEDQKNRGYYYDDAHGYKTYVPDLDDEDGDDQIPDLDCAAALKNDE